MSTKVRLAHGLAQSAIGAVLVVVLLMFGALFSGALTPTAGKLAGAAASTTVYDTPITVAQIEQP
ncbi:MAG: hypothetical protein HY329_22040 [Chloroflexi bacterium]|nr:hypothetical protein [Chloroflexota bacterium]